MGVHLPIPNALGLYMCIPFLWSPTKDGLHFHITGNILICRYILPLLPIVSLLILAKSSPLLVMLITFFSESLPESIFPDDSQTSRE
jgi:hypothetical protein